MSIWSWLLLMSCGRSVPPPALAEPEPSLEEVCPTVPPRGYRVERGEASAPDRATALTAARKEATDRLLNRLCGGLSEARCAEVGSAVRPWQEGYHDARTGFACASVAVASDVLEGVETEAERLQSDLAALAAAVAKAEGPVSLADPMWSEGCDAGIAGDKLNARVTNALAAHDVPFGDGGPKLGLTLTPGRDVITVTAELRDEQGTTALPGFTAPLAALPLPEGVVMGCQPPEPTGRDASDRAELVAWLTDVVTDCEGRVGSGHRGLEQWWVRFKVQDESVRGITLSAGMESPAPQAAQFAVGTCIREALKSEVWAPGEAVFKATIQSELSDDAREPPLPEPVDGVALVLRNPARDWLDVRIDGKVVAELRTQTEVTVAMSPGVHRIEVLEFMADTPFFVGRLDTLERERVIIGLSLEARTVTAFDGTGLEPLPR